MELERVRWGPCCKQAWICAVTRCMGTYLIPMPSPPEALSGDRGASSCQDRRGCTAGPPAPSARATVPLYEAPQKISLGKGFCFSGREPLA